ncbi:MAG: DUF6754 domain-containing protein [Candidatus Cloacimonadales bacterium]
MVKRTLFFIILLLGACSLLAEISLEARDKPNDDGSSIILDWEFVESGDAMAELQLFRRHAGGRYYPIAIFKDASGSYTDGNEIEIGMEYAYKINVMSYVDNPSQPGEKVLLIVESAHAKATSSAQWFNSSKISVLILGLIISLSIVWFIFSARSGKELYIRKIAGLESMDESVGRATEMGKPILFVPGTLDLDNMQTIAGLTILGKLAERAARYDTEIIVPVCRSMVLSTAREIVKESYLKAGRPDAFKPDSVFYLTDDQFGFVAGVDGIIVREKPAANFFMGAFYAESLILAETGFASGAIQTAGTAMPSQLPFFVTACDYTLIGEELFAASAYLSKDPQQLGSLKGQDIGKAVFLIVLITGIIFEIIGVSWLKDFLTLY